MRYPVLPLLVLSLLVRGQSHPQKPVTVLMATYTDPAGDLSFDYPAVRKIANSANNYIPPYIVMAGVSPQVQVVFSPAGKVYKTTNLANLVFVYAKTVEPSPQTGTTMAMGAQPQKTDTRTIHGLSFQHFHTFDGAMCHEADQQVFWTYRGGTCYVFQGDRNTTYPGMVDGQRGADGGGDGSVNAASECDSRVDSISG